MAEASGRHHSRGHGEVRAAREGAIGPADVASRQCLAIAFGSVSPPVGAQGPSPLSAPSCGRASAGANPKDRRTGSGRVVAAWMRPNARPMAKGHRSIVGFRGQPVGSFWARMSTMHQARKVLFFDKPEKISMFG